MRFKIKTLVDITNTNMRRRNNLESLQQDNFDTIAQTIGLRVNPVDVDVYMQKEKVDEFGSIYKGEHNVWYFVFTPNTEGSISIDTMIEDFDLVPFVDQLTETMTFDKACFQTKDSKFKNIIFQTYR